MSYERVHEEDRVGINNTPVINAPVPVPQAVQSEFVLVTPPNPTAEEFFQTILNRRVEFNISKYVQEAWTFTKYNLCHFVGIALVYSIVTAGLWVAWNFAVFGDFDMDVYVNETKNIRYEMDWNWTTILISLAFGVGSYLFFYIPMFASLYKAVFNAMRNNSKIKFGDFFSCFQCPYWWRLMLVSTVLFVVREIGFWLFVVPGVYVSIATVFSIPMHGEHTFMGVVNSIKYSVKVVNRYFFSILAFILCLGFLQVLGVLCFGVGVLVTLPVAFVATCYCYHHLIGVNGVAVLMPLSQLGVDAAAAQVQLSEVAVTVAAPSAPVIV